MIAKLYKPGVPNPREVVVEPTRDSRRSSLLSSVELDTPTENKVTVTFLLNITVRHSYRKQGEGCLLVKK